MSDREIKDLYNQIEKLYNEIDHINHKLAQHLQHKAPNHEGEKFSN